MTHFVPADPAAHERGNRGEEVTDWCLNCTAPFHAHTNGRCPPNWGCACSPETLRMVGCVCHREDPDCERDPDAD